MDVVPEDVVISGIGGFYPKATNLEDFKNRLFENKPLQEPRWPESKNMSNLIGCVESNYFDNSYFGIHRQQCFFMDPMHRLALEGAFSALLDAGVNPTEIRGKRVGVFMGSTIGENDQLFMESVVSGFGVTGHSRAMLANRISYWLNLKGPSIAYDANWVTGIEVLRLAFYAIKTGQCDSVIVGAANLAQHDEFQHMYNEMGLISLDGSTKAFDANASGYARSEGVVLMYVQRASEARRHYASIVHVACKFDGTSPNGFLNIETESMLEFLEDFYKHSKVKPEEIDFVEAYGCANKNTDKNELDALEKIYCKNRKNPLLIGSVKTITGHAEPTSALFSIIKTIIAMENDKIPATLQFETPNPEIKALNNGSIEVVTTNRKWEPKYAAVNALSTSSHLGHIVLKANPKKKVNRPIDLPILLIASTRTEEGILSILETFKKKPKDLEYNKLVQDVFSKSIQGHLYRGYLMMGQEDNKQDTINHMGNKRAVWFVYSGMGSQWNGMLGDLMKIDVFAESIKRSCDILAKKDVDLMKILSSPDKTIFDNILNCFVGIAAMQIALTDVLRALGIVPDGIIGHSVGELGCAYADGCMTAEQMILSSYSRGRASIEATLIPGMMAAIGLGYNQIKNKLPPTIEVACRNGPESCTISGPAEDMAGFVKDLQNQGVFARLVNVANIAYHSRYIKPAAPLLLKYLKQVIPKPVARSPKWISTSNVEANWDTDLAKHSSAEYHTNNLLSSVLFEEGINHIPKDSVLIEIAPHGLLQAILKRSVKECTSIPLTQKGAKSSSEFFFNSLGKIYLSGIDIKISNIYPKIEYPVSRNTSSLTDLVHWNHTETWNRSQEAQRTISGVRNVNININSEEFSYCFTHKLHEQIVVPVSTYLDIILQITDNAFGGHGVVFENVHFKRHLIVPNIGIVSVNAVVQPGSGEFEIFSDNELVVKGKITIVEDKDDMDDLEVLEIPVTKESVYLSENDVYTELEHRGYKLEGIFKGIKQLTLSQKGSTACREWNNKWKDLIETMVQQHAFYVGERNQQVFVPKYIQKISMVHGLLPSTNSVKINYEYCTRSLFTSGIEMNDIKSIPFQMKTKNVELNGVDIMQLDDNIFSEIEFGIEQALQLTINNFKGQNTGKLCISEVETDLPLQDKIKTVISEHSTINIKSSYVKELKQIVMADNVPQLLVMNDIVNSEVLSLMSNSWSVFLFVKDDPGRRLDDGNIAVVSRFRYGSDHYIICRKATTNKARIININQKELSIKDLEKKSVPWVSDLFNTVKQNQKTPILLVTSLIPTEGFINFMKGIRRIPNSNNIRIFYNLDENPQSIEEALKRNLSLTILKTNCWYTYLSMAMKFDETTESKLSQTPLIENRLISYIGLNLKDETITPELTNKNEIGNIDYCGVTKNGKRVMGLAYLDQESSKLVVDDTLTWDVPEGFSLDDAVTVPHAYVSAYYMMVIKGRIKHGETVLIHAGCSAIGLAAISVAYSYGCQIYTTVQTNRQRVYLKKHYVFLQDRNIFDSSSNFDTDFLLATGGNGAHLLLNCLSGSSLKSTFACTGKYGRFIQYCKYDLEQGNTIGMSQFLNNADFYHVDLQNVFHQNKAVKQEIRNLISEGFETYIVRPIKKDIIKHHNISTIMKKLESPEIIGKIIIDAVNNLSVNKLNVKEPHRYICNSRNTYLVFGGSAESWIDMAEWLVHRGARKVIISSDSKPTENYLNRRLTILENYYGADVIMAASKIQSESGALELLSEVSNLGALNTMFILPNETGSSAYIDEIVEPFDKALRKIAPRALLVNFIPSSTGICYKRSMSGYFTNNIEFSNQEKICDVIPSLDAILNSSCNNVILKKLNTGDSTENANVAVINDATRLLPKLEDIINLQKNAPNEPELVQVLTEGPAEIRELAPVFIIPGLTGYKELETFTRHLLYPAFCAVYPSTPWPFEKLAEVYAQKIIEVFPREFYNIISISSGGPLAIEVAKILTKKTADVHLFLIDSPPVRVQQGFQNLGENDVQVEVDLLRTVFEKNDLEIVKQLKSCPNFEARIKMLLQRLEKSEKNKKLLEKGLIFVKDFMERVKKFKPDNELLPGRVHILVPDDCNAFENYGLSSYFKNTPTITQVPGDHLSIITNSVTFEYVNQNHYQIY